MDTPYETLIFGKDSIDTRYGNIVQAYRKQQRPLEYHLRHITFHGNP